ncbi:MAG TPA: hypothetical protein VNC84_08095 [Gammaproteobacteria bacterium]|jgi:hypothetical protein|nr:hypothetical protein [Gammaproteobacteria bacterium]
MLEKRNEVAHFQSLFYREKFRKTLRWIEFLIVVMWVLVGCIVYVVLAEPHQRYYANTTDGIILPMPKAVHRSIGLR